MNYRGLEGYLAIGGVLSNATPKIKGAVAAGQTSCIIDGDGLQLKGVLAGGDQFAIIGESGLPSHVITSPQFAPIPLVAPYEVQVNFTPPIAAGGVPDNALVMVQANAIVQAKAYTLQPSKDILDVSAFGDSWRKVAAGLSRWSGTGVAWFDYADPRQQQALGVALGATPGSGLLAVLFGVTAGKTWYAQAHVSQVAVVAQIGQIVEATFNFEGSGAENLVWA